MSELQTAANGVNLQKKYLSTIGELKLYIKKRYCSMTFFSNIHFCNAIPFYIKQYQKTQILHLFAFNIQVGISTILFPIKKVVILVTGQFTRRYNILFAHGKNLNTFLTFFPFSLCPFFPFAIRRSAKRKEVGKVMFHGRSHASPWQECIFRSGNCREKLIGG